MTKGKHTKGPWTAYKYAGEWFVSSKDYDSGPMVDVGGWPKDREANAHLIAASPDYHEEAHKLAMLVLQSDLYSSDPDVRDSVDNVLAIHAKARGNEND